MHVGWNVTGVFLQVLWYLFVCYQSGEFCIPALNVFLVSPGRARIPLSCSFYPHRVLHCSASCEYRPVRTAGR